MTCRILFLNGRFRFSFEGAIVRSCAYETLVSVLLVSRHGFLCTTIGPGCGSTLGAPDGESRMSAPLKRTSMICACSVGPAQKASER